MRNVLVLFLLFACAVSLTAGNVKVSRIPDAVNEEWPTVATNQGPAIGITADFYVGCKDICRDVCPNLVVTDGAMCDVTKSQPCTPNILRYCVKQTDGGSGTLSCTNCPYW
jgi:hypothetical protein